MYGQLYATFAEPGDAEKAAGALLDFGALPEDLTIIQSHSEEHHASVYQAVNAPEPIPQNALDQPFTIYKETPVSSKVDEEDDRTETEYEAKHSISTTTTGDAGIGAAKGLGWGVGVGTAAAVASLFIPGVGLVIGGGALATAIAGAIATTGAGAVAGAVTGYLKDQGFEEDEQRRYVETMSNGGAVLSLGVPSGNVSYEKACEIIEKYKGAQFLKVIDRTSYLA